MSTKLYLKSGTGKNKVTLTIPVLPEKIEISDSANHNSVNIGDIGEIQLKQGRKAKTISFSSFFPASAFQGSAKTVNPPISYVEQIEKWLDDKTTVTLVLTRDSNNHLGFSMKVLITAFKYSEEGADVGTIHYNLSFKEHRTVTVNEVKSSKKGTKKKSTSNRSSTKSSETTYKIKSGDCLWNIAKSKLGSGNRWKEIYNLNKTVIENAAKKHGRKSSQTGHWIYPGTVIKIPKK